VSPVDWPAAALDPIRRAKVIASALPSAAWAETTLDAPYQQVWSWLTDFRHSIHRFDTQVSRVRERGRRSSEGAVRVDLAATSFGVPVPFRVRLEDGFCLMQARARVYLVVMAAVPDGERTRFCHVEAVPLPGTGRLRPHIQHVVDSDLRNLARLAAAGFPAV
jgi:hypothetical protein